MFVYSRSYEQAGLLSKENKEIEQAVQYMERASFMYQEHGTPDTAALRLEKAAKYVGYNVWCKLVKLASLICYYN